MRGHRIHLFLAIALLLLQACSGLRNAGSEKPLFTDLVVKFTDRPDTLAKMLRAELENTVIPSPNNSIFGMRPTVALYNSTKEPKVPSKGFRNFLKYKIGSAPVYLDQVPLTDIDAAMVNRMNNRGYFKATAVHVVNKGKRTATVRWTVDPGPLHRIRHIEFSDSLSLADTSDTLAHELEKCMGSSGLYPGSPYDLDALIAERSRVTNLLRDTGYYEIRDRDLEFATDTTVGDLGVDIRLRIKSTTSESVRRRYRVGAVYVHGDRDDLLAANDTVELDSLHYIDYLGMYRPTTITRGVFLRDGQYYSQSTTDQTRRFLASYGVFRSTQIKYAVDSTAPGRLRTDVILVPQKRFSLFTEVNAIAQSNNFAGPGAKVGLKDRGLFRGAEVLSVDLNGSFESQIAGDGKGTNAYTLEAKAELNIPRLVFLPRVRSARSYAPTTRIGMGYGLYRRINLYGLESATANYRYVWRKNDRVWHEVQGLEISYNNLYYTSSVFDAYLARNPSIRRSFQEQFIVGLGYTYTLSTQRGANDLSWWLLSAGLDESGTLLGAALDGINGPSEDGQTLFGQKFSQYVRFRPEVVWHQRIGPYGAQLVWRTLASIAIPFGNSSTVPYVKQFYSGGTNSLRGFRARSIGPGSYSPDPTNDSNGTLLVDQVGDIKFESNMEYRFPITGFFKGALFADVGNVWLYNEDPQRPGGRFKFDTALDQLAVSAGAGLRFDPEVIVIRMDLGVPLRRPDLSSGDRWVFDDLRPQLRDNFILNIAIGYPF
jgi:outer membrane protein assembly factor BamA